jgi:tetratricopeptide (TPR) repeat protein
VYVFREAAMITDSIEPPGAYYAGRSRFFIAHAYLRMNRLSEAERELRESLRVYAQPLEATNESYGIADSEYWLGQLLIRQRRDAEASGHVRAAYDTWLNLPNRASNAARAAEDLAELYRRLGAADSAAAWQQRAINVRGT